MKYIKISLIILCVIVFECKSNKISVENKNKTEDTTFGDISSVNFLKVKPIIDSAFENYNLEIILKSFNNDNIDIKCYSLLKLIELEDSACIKIIIHILSNSDNFKREKGGERRAQQYEFRTKLSALIGKYLNTKYDYSRDLLIKNKRGELVERLSNISLPDTARSLDK